MNQQPPRRAAPRAPVPSTMRRTLPAAALLLAAATVLPACAPLVMGGAVVGTALAVADRRTSGAQVEDQAIELKSIARLRDALDGRGNVNITSYNRIVLLSGEAVSEADKAAAERANATNDNVRGTVNEVAVMGASSITSRTSDGIITSKVKATLLEAKDLHGNAIKVVTERGTVYLMGIVTEREAGRAVELTRAVSGVGRVVRVFEIVTEAELAAIQNPPAKK
jgi:osmotically-inducible protein OsmY